MDKDYVFERVKMLKEAIFVNDDMDVDARNKAIDELDDLQETIAYRDLPLDYYKGMLVTALNRFGEHL